MISFRRRSGKNLEYSGYNEASEQLRNRILNCVKRHIGEPDPYGLEYFHGIYESMLNAKLDEEYGVQNSDYSKFIKLGDAEDVFTVVEIIIQLGHEQLYDSNFKQLIRELIEAFKNSGSVYEINIDGQVALKLDESTQVTISEAEFAISGFEEAKSKYQQAVAKLVARKPALEVVQDTYLSLEKYVKAKSGISGKNAFDQGVNKILSKKPVQKEFVKKLKGFKGNAKDISHDGNYEIDEKDALWYIRSVGAVFSLLE